MNSVLEKYFSRKKNELLEYIDKIIPMFSYNIDITINNKSQAIKKILNIYYDKYYKVSYINYENVYKYYKFDQESSNDFKTIIKSTIEYFESENKAVLENSNNVLYLAYIIYFAFLIDRLKETIVMLPNKADFIISISNKVSSNFKCTKNDRFKNHVNKLNSLIKNNIKSESKIKNEIEKLFNTDSHNEYVSISDEKSLYKINYKYNINDLKRYKDKDIEKVFNEENLGNTFKLMSYELALVALLKCLFKEQRINLVIDFDKNFYKKKMNVNAFLKMVSNAYTAEYTKVLIKASEYTEDENINYIKAAGIEIIIDSDRIDEINNIKFDEKMSLITTKEFIINHKDELDNKKIKYVKKTTERIYNENDLFYTTVDFVEVL